MQEQQSTERAEIDIAARVSQELKAREEAERAADAQYRTEAEARAQKSATERKARGAETKGAEPAYAPGRKKNKLLWVAVGAVVAIVAALGLLQFIPLSGYVPGVQELMAKRLGKPVSITRMRYELFPTPQLTLERVSIGKLQEIKAEAIYVPIGPIGLVSGTHSFDTVDVKGVTLDTDALGAVAGWVAAQQGEPPLQVIRMRLKSVKLTARGVEIPPLDVDATFGARGALSKATISIEKARLEVTPKEKTWDVKLSASGWKSFIGPAVEFDDLEASAVVDASGATVSDIKGRVGGGALSGQLKATWGNAIQASGDVKIENGRLNQLMPFFTRNFTSSGTVTLSATYAMSATTVNTLFENLRLDGSFSVAGGELNNVDIVRALQTARADGQRGGKTRFDNLSGTMQINGAQYSYRQLQLNSGPMNASGAVSVNGGALSGSIHAELGTKGLVVARGVLSPGGTLRDPVLR